jgi:chaperonin cofactor prefoldin
MEVFDLFFFFSFFFVEFNSQEFKHLKQDAVVYKLIGPALIKQDTNEAVQNVNKRIEYISNEM